MCRKILISFIVMIQLLVFVCGMFSMGVKLQKVPQKTYTNINIPDGEFLHYGNYLGGEKDIDYYQVTRKITNGYGGYYYKIYFNIISAASGKKLPENYSNWPASIVIDPVRGSTMETEGKLETNDMKNWASFGVGGLTYWHYKLLLDKGIVEYTSKSLKGDETMTKNYKIKVKTEFPLFDMFSSSILSTRFMDVHSPGITYLVIPDFMKEPLPITQGYVGKGTVTTKAGTFKVNRLNLIMADQFLGKLMESMLKNANMMVEDTDKRFLVKRQLQSLEFVLEDISNAVKMK